MDGTIAFVAVSHSEMPSDDIMDAPMDHMPPGRRRTIKPSTAVVVPRASPLLARCRSSPYSKTGRMGSLSSPSSLGSPEVKSSMVCKILKHVFEKRWEPDSGTLRLTALETDEDLAGTGVNFNTMGFCGKVAKVLNTHFRNVQTLVMTENSIYTLAHIGRQLALYQLSGFSLDLAGNQIKNVSEVQHLASLELTSLILLDNPLAAKAEYHAQCVKTLRSIRHLDNVDVTKWRRELLPKLPPVASPSYCNPPNVADMVLAFRNRYFELIDRQQFDELSDAYSSNVVSSVALSPETVAPSSLTAEYLANLEALSSNMKQCADASTRNVATGRLSALTRLRQHVYCCGHTVIEVESIEHHRQAMHMDVQQLGPHALVATVHCVATLKLKRREDDDGVERATGDAPVQLFPRPGETETVSRCVDRTWILSPAPPGGQWPCQIQNEQVSIRRLQQTAVAAKENSALQLEQHLAQLQQLTGLTDEWVLKLSSAAEHNLDRAQVIFKQTQAEGKIPQNAFEHGAVA
eukprot:NODE_669_length_1718_cov_72.697674_g659_i0.p1 GENE.NODE_669_length_1718_cov_72.697674_g659_i0~~NODE_669_length_1718_cov_72.697674_g659_i0.p1  ORF type:complete len:519 (-),score=52.03 NODE_669_length_1718_cov_72.697674_g659_i0:73-1629(-)